MDNQQKKYSRIRFLPGLLASILCVFFVFLIVLLNPLNSSNFSAIASSNEYLLHEKDKRILSYYREPIIEDDFEEGMIYVVFKYAFSDEICLDDFETKCGITDVSAIEYKMKTIEKGSAERIQLDFGENSIVMLFLSKAGKEAVLVAAQKLLLWNAILIAEPKYNSYIQYDLIPNDEYYVEQWGLNGGYGIDIESAWDLAKNTSAIKVGIFEKNVFFNHEDLNGCVYNGNGIDPVNNAKHGTHVAGIIGAIRNDVGITGISNSSIYCLNSSDFVNSLTYAENNNIKIINASFHFVVSSTDSSYAPYNAVDYAAISDYDGLLVCSAGNDNINLDTTPMYPACYNLPNVLCIGAINSYGICSSFSNYGVTKVSLFAPGEDILSTYPISLCTSGDCDLSWHYANGYHKMSGTSMAAPFVTGVAVLCKSVNPNLSSAQIKSIIMDTVNTSTSLSSYCVSGGRLNAYEAVKKAAFNISGSSLTGVNYTMNGAYQIPDSIGGTTITSIGAQAFRNQTGLTGITLPSTITTIGNRAFQFCTSLASADLSATSITRIEDYTFDTCPLGTSLSLPSTLTYIGEGAFIRATGLTSIVLPASVTTINSYAFYSCTNLATVDLSATGVNTISPHCFESCLLDDFYYPPNVTSIGNSAFRYAGGPTNRNIPSGVTIIGDYAFANASDILNYGFPSSLKTIGNYAISNNGSSLIKLDNTSIETIGEGAFANTELVLTSRLPSTLKLIGMNAFYQSGFKNNNLIIDGAEPVENDPDENGLAITSYAFTSCNLEEIRITKNVTYIGILAFNGNSARVTYIEDDTPIDGWEAYWNIGDGSFPVFRKCVFSSDYSYIISFEKENGNPQNVTSSTATPTRKNYTFGGWYRESDPNTLYMDVTTAPNETLCAKWTSSSCIAAGSLITLADGTQVAVENLTGNESLLVWNMLTGQYDTAPILFIDSDPLSTYEVITLTFSDNTQVKVIYEHAFFDMTIGEYVFLRNDAAQYIGHYFNKKNGNTWTTVQLTNVSVGTEYTTAWSPVTYGHLCYYVNGMLTMPGATEGFINIFDVDTTLMKYDAEQMASDIQTYGLYTYEEFNAIIPLPELVFNAFNGQYLKVSIGKGLITLSEIAELLERYTVFFT